MSWLSAQFFAQVQAAPFYTALHRQAVSLLPPTERRTWLDAGCGPGLVSRLAAERGYDTLGTDLDPAMVRQARSCAGLGAPTRGALRFETSSLFDLPNLVAPVDVVSAASLLAVLPDRQAALRALVACLKPDGVALVIEPTADMTADRASAYLRAHPGTRMSWVLRMWARTRTPARAVGVSDLRLPGWQVQPHPLLDGMVHAWVIRPTACAGLGGLR